MRSMTAAIGMAPGPHATDRGVDGVHGKRLVATSGSSPEAAQRCAAGAGLDAAGAHQSTIKRAVTCGPPSERTKSIVAGQFRTARRYTPNLQQIDGREPGNIVDEAMTSAR